MFNGILGILGGLIVALLIIVPAVKTVKQWEKGVVLRFGRYVSLRDSGLNFIIPYVDRMIKVDTRVETMVVEPQEVITKDNVTIQVDAVVYIQVINPEDAVMKVIDYEKATSQISLTTLRSVLGQSELDELLAHRDRINTRIRDIVDEQTEPWGIMVSHVEVKDVLLPASLQRAMARQAEAEREKRAKIIHAEGERAAASTLADAAHIISLEPISLQLRYLQTLTEMSSEKTSTIIPITLDVLGALTGSAGRLPKNGNGEKVRATPELELAA